MIINIAGAIFLCNHDNLGLDSYPVLLNWCDFEYAKLKETYPMFGPCEEKSAINYPSYDDLGNSTEQKHMYRSIDCKISHTQCSKKVHFLKFVGR